MQKPSQTMIPPQGQVSLTSTQNAALQAAIDRIGSALSQGLGGDSFEYAILELEQLLDQVRPISKCEVCKASLIFLYPCSGTSH